MTKSKADSCESALRYDFPEIDLDSGSVHADVVQLVPEGSRVLELGPATGYMSRVFRDRGCTVVGIELDPAMAERARGSCERLVIGDLDTLDLSSELGDERFDAIVAADVIEHLKDPLEALRRLRPFLSEDGCFVISIPNIAHGSVRLALLSGHFDYQKRGLLDSTHLRFFTRDTFGQLLDEAELGVAELHRHDVEFAVSEVSFDPTIVSSEMRDELERDPDARTYQFVVKAIPMGRDGLRETQARLRELAELRNALGQARRREDELQGALAAAREQAARDRREIGAWEERHEADTHVLHGEIEDLRKESLRLQVRLDRILATPPVRIYAALRALPGLRAIERRRKSAVQTDIEERFERTP